MSVKATTPPDPHGARDVNTLFDYAVAHPGGFTYVDVGDDLGWERKRFYGAARRLRRVFGNDEDTINLVCDPQGQGEPWLYRLVGTVEEAQGWVANRDRDLGARLTTMIAVANSLVSATDGRSKDGRRARMIHSTLDYLRVQLAMLD